MADAAGPSPDEPAAPRRRPDPLLAFCVVALLAFPFAATWAADRQLRDSDAPVADAGSKALRDVPAFTPGGRVAAAVARGQLLTRPAAMRAAVGDAVAALFAPGDRRTVEALIGRDDIDARTPRYPYRFPELEPLLDRAGLRSPSPRRVRAASDLGALLVLDAALSEDSQSAPARVAFAVLDRARARGDCSAQLNLGFLLIADSDAGAAEDELRRADRVCRDDPTPLWILGQVQSRDALSQSGAGHGDRPDAVFRQLRRRLPSSPAGWSGAGDNELRLAYRAGERRLFSARHHFLRAQSLYEQAIALDGDDPGLQAGAARALAGLGGFRRAALAQRTALAGQGDSADLLARDVEYLERAQEFPDAARAAAGLAKARFARGPALFAQRDGLPEAVIDEDAQGPLSSGAGRLLEVSITWAPRLPFTDGGGGGNDGAPPPTAAPAGTVVNDFSFIPQFRAVDGVTGTDRWCPSWSRPRDLVLARQPAAALRALPASYADVRSATDGCAGAADEDIPTLRAIARFEAGGAAPADAAAAAALHDDRQNMWRFAGDYRRARAATAAWAKVAPRDPTPLQRAGEIAFLGEDHDEAARLFGVSARMARARPGERPLAEAEALVRRGTALELARRYAEAQDALAAADESASRVAAQTTDSGTRGRAAFLAYTARAQSGDTFLRTRNFAAATEQYAAAREEEPALRACDCTPDRRPEALDNNLAIAEIARGDLAAAQRDAARALKADPLSPVFLQTLGLAQARAGRFDAAAESYRAAIRSDPSAYPAANALGIVLARRTRYAAAGDAFRTAVSAAPGYAAGWFNLGVALERIGPRRALSAQGAFAKAFRLDDDLRTREHAFISDDRLRFSSLDLSKPLPENWSYAEAQDRAPAAAAGFALALLLALRLSRNLMSGGAGANAKKYLDLLRERLSRLMGFTPAVVAVAATLAVLLWPTVHSDASGASVVLLLLGTAALMTIVLRARRTAARALGVDLRQRGWAPGVVASIAATLAGAGWAPLPVAETSHDARVVHWIGPLAAALMGTALLALGAWLAVPATTALGTVGLVMAASLLVPIKPLDGGFLGEGAVALVTNVLLVAVGVLLVLGVA